MIPDKGATRGPASEPLLTNSTLTTGGESVFLFPNLTPQARAKFHFSCEMFYGSFDPYNHLEM